MKSSRKLDNCLNCGQSLFKSENFCPQCGQKNYDQRVSIGVFLKDFISNYLSFDASFFRTTKPFLIKPGKLTLEFNAGKRNYYIHPIRLYLIFSLFYFFVVGFVIPVNSFDAVMSTISSTSMEEEVAQMDSTKRVELERILSDNDQHGLLSSIKEKNTRQTDSLKQTTKWSYIKAAALDTEVSDKEFGTILKKYPVQFAGPFSIEKKRDLIANSNLYLTNAIRNLPIMMFLLLPVFALFLFLLFKSSKGYYIEHLIHALHLHSFAYFIYGIGIILLISIKLEVDWILLVSFITVSTYAFFSILRIYKNTLLKSLFKFLTLGFVYFLILMSALVLELYISLLML